MNLNPSVSSCPSVRVWYLAAAEVLEEEGEGLDHAAVFGTVSVGVTQKDFGTRPGPLGDQRCALIGRLAALLVQMTVDVLCRTTNTWSKCVILTDVL